MNGLVKTVHLKNSRLVRPAGLVRRDEVTSTPGLLADFQASEGATNVYRFNFSGDPLEDIGSIPAALINADAAINESPTVPETDGLFYQPLAPQGPTSLYATGVNVGTDVDVYYEAIYSLETFAPQNMRLCSVGVDGFSFSNSYLHFVLSDSNVHFTPFIGVSTWVLNVLGGSMVGNPTYFGVWYDRSNFQFEIYVKQAGIPEKTLVTTFVLPGSNTPTSLVPFGARVPQNSGPNGRVHNFALAKQILTPAHRQQVYALAGLN